VITDPSLILKPVREDAVHNYAREREISRREVLRFTSELTEQPDQVMKRYVDEIRNDGKFQSKIEDILNQTEERPGKIQHNYREICYAVIRQNAPKYVVETGVYDGLSSAYILRALERNSGDGTLISIDINDDVILPSDIPNVRCGWIVPQQFTDNWDLRIGDSVEELSTVLKQFDVELLIQDVSDPTITLNEMKLGVENMPKNSTIITSYNNSNAEYDRFVELRNDNLNNISEVPKSENGMFCGGLVQ
jgi:hypothetical protein